MKNATISKKSMLSAVWVIILFALLTLADAYSPNYGVESLRIYQNKIVANVSYQYYASMDGGLTWEEADYIDDYFPLFNENSNQTQVSIPDTQISYRIDPSGTVETSIDQGLTWQILNLEHPVNDRDQYYNLKIHPNAVINTSSARDVIYDPVTGNVIFSQGLLGVLIVTPDGKQISAGVGSFQPVDLSQPSAFFTLLLPHFLLALGLIIISAYIIHFSKNGLTHWVVILFSLALWAVSLFLIFEQSYGIPYFWLAFAALALVLLGMLIYTIVTLQKGGIINWRQLIFLALIAALLFLCPYLFWYALILPTYQWALYSSVFCVLIWLIYCVNQS